jgi:hypothetical protein
MFSTNYELINITGNLTAIDIVTSIFDKISEIEKKDGKEYLSDYDKDNKKFIYLAEYLKDINCTIPTEK